MANMIFWVCLILVFHTFTSWSEARPLNPFIVARNPNKSLRPTLVGAKSIVKMRLELEVTKKRQMSDTNRVGDPGGPDPWHH